MYARQWLRRVEPDIRDDDFPEVLSEGSLRGGGVEGGGAEI